MKNFKNLMTVFIVTIMLNSMITVFAADSATIENADKAVALKDLGLYTGHNLDDPTVGLENPLTTQDSLIFLSKALGYYDDANLLTENQVNNSLAIFSDASSVSEYAKNVVAYSAANGILTGSTQNGKFFIGAKDTVSAARFATFMLKQMGYTVADYRVSVDQLAGIKGSKVDATLTGDLNRDAAVGIMYGALTAEKANGKTVIADIIGDNAELKAQAEKIGLLNPPSQQEDSTGSGSSSSSSKPLSIVSVEAINNKQLQITFNQEMNKSSVEDRQNYRVYNKTSELMTLTDNSCKLSDDKKTVTITFDNTVQDCLTNDTSATVVVSKNIKPANAKRLGEDYKLQVRVLDEVQPTIKDVKVIGTKNIRITFSEPIYEHNSNSKVLNPNNFSLKCGTYSYTVQKAELDIDAINLELAIKLIEGPHRITVNPGSTIINQIQDYAGYPVLANEYPFDIAKQDDEPLVVTKYTVNKNESITILFNKLIDKEFASKSENYAVTDLTNQVDIYFLVEIGDSPNSVNLKFDEELNTDTEYQLLIKDCKDISGKTNMTEYKDIFYLKLSSSA